MKISRKRDIKASPKTIWGIVSSIDTLPSWYAGVESGLHTAGPKNNRGRQQTLRRILYGREVHIEQEVVGWEPLQCIRFAHLKERVEGQEVRGVNNFHTTILITSLSDSTQVEIEYSWKAGFGLTWILSLFLAGRVMGREISQTLRNIESLTLG